MGRECADCGEYKDESQYEDEGLVCRACDGDDEAFIAEGFEAAIEQDDAAEREAQRGDL
jgi:hypothetical protein